MSEVLSFEEACLFLKVAAPTLYGYVRRGEVPGFKMGRVWKFHRESLELWIKSRVVEDTKMRSSRSTPKKALKK